jgi:hypothetical protein
MTRVEIHTVQGDVYELSCKESATVAMVKAHLVVKARSIPVDACRLIRSGKVLSDDTPIASLAKESPVHIILHTTCTSSSPPRPAVLPPSERRTAIRHRPVSPKPAPGLNVVRAAPPNIALGLRHVPDPPLAARPSDSPEFDRNVNMLIDMGFARGAAEQALRLHARLEAAVEWLISH